MYRLVDPHLIVETIAKDDKYLSGRYGRYLLNIRLYIVEKHVKFLR